MKTLNIDNAMQKENGLDGLIKAAGMFDVHKWSEYPEVKAIVDGLFNEVIQHRKNKDPKSRIRDGEKIKKHLRVLLLDLYVSSQSLNPWRSISKRKGAYKNEVSRYRKLHLKYYFLIPLVNNLVELDYVEEKKGYFDRMKHAGKQTRIKATEKLINKVESAKFGLKEAIKAKGLLSLVVDNPEVERETIILRDKNKKNVDYEDTEETNRMRDNLRLINQKLTQNRITLKINDEQFAELGRRLVAKDNDKGRLPDFSHKTLCRIFNEDFQHGGRFFGGWWEIIPKDYRKYIEINHKHVEEVDFSGHHIRILYALEKQEPPDDPYDLDAEGFSREDIKQAFLDLINAPDRTATKKALASDGIKNAEALLNAIEERHKPISHHFYSGVGLSLQYEDSVLAESVMLRMLDRGVVVLPVHDSFIVRNTYKEELEEVMDQVFQEQFHVESKMKAKPNVLDVPRDVEEGEDNLLASPFLETSLEDIFKDMNNYSKHHHLWGMN